MVRSPYMLNSGWLDPALPNYDVPNLVAEAARSLGVQDDRVRLALAESAVRQGRNIGRWEEAVAVAAAAGGTNTRGESAGGAPADVTVTGGNCGAPNDGEMGEASGDAPTPALTVTRGEIGACGG